MKKFKLLTIYFIITPEVFKNVKKMVKKITAEQILDLIYQDFTWKEIAQKLNISEMTISRRLNQYQGFKQYSLKHVNNILLTKFKSVIKKSIGSMKTHELKIIHMLLTDKNVSMTKLQYQNQLKKLIKNANKKE